MARVKPRCHILLSGYEIARIRHSLELFPAYKVYAVENRSPIPQHEPVVKDIHEKMRDLLQKMGYEENERFFWYGVDFFRLDDATVGLYELLLKELSEGFEVIVNITSGPKIASVAATLAASLAKCGVVYIAAEKYAIDSKTGRVTSIDFIREPFFLEPLLELSESLLHLSTEEIAIIKKLFQEKEVRTITELASEKKQTPEKATIARYSYYLRQLQRRNLVNLADQAISLTSLGNFIFRLITVKQKYQTSAHQQPPSST